MYLVPQLLHNYTFRKNICKMYVFFLTVIRGSASIFFFNSRCNKIMERYERSCPKNEVYD